MLQSGVEAEGVAAASGVRLGGGWGQTVIEGQLQPEGGEQGAVQQDAEAVVVDLAGGRSQGVGAAAEGAPGLPEKEALQMGAALGDGPQVLVGGGCGR